MTATWRRICLEMLLLLLLGGAIGLAFNQRLLRDVLAGRAVSVPAPVEQSAWLEPATLEETRTLLAQGGLAVDARAEELFAEGHLPGALSLPLATAQAGDLATRVPPGRVLLVYCSGYGCSDSFDLAQLLLQAGFREIRLFEGGFPAWRDAGLPVVKEGR